MNFVVLKRNSGKLFISLFLLAAMLVYLPANSAKADVIYATDGIDYFHVESPIVITFDRAIQYAPNISDTTFDGIVLEDDETSLPVNFSLEKDGNRLKVIPDSPLESNREYNLKITKDIVLDLSGSSVFEDEDPLSDTNKMEYSFSTKSLTFLDLMKGEEGAISKLLEYYTPRQMMVTAPVRYVDEMEIIHRKKGIGGEATTSLTNIALDIDDPAGKVGSIVVKAGDQTLYKTYLNASDSNGSRTYDFAFSGLTDEIGYDLNVYIFSSVIDPDIELNLEEHLETEKDYLLDKRVYKVALKDSPSTIIKVKDRYKMAGKSYSLYQLLAKEKDLQKLLDENENMEELKVQVVEEN